MNTFKYFENDTGAGGRGSGPAVVLSTSPEKTLRGTGLRGSTAESQRGQWGEMR